MGRLPYHAGFSGLPRSILPEADCSESPPLIAFNMSPALVEMIKRCGDEPTRQNIMQVASSPDLAIGSYVRGVRIRTSRTDYLPIEQLQMMRFDWRKEKDSRLNRINPFGIIRPGETAFTTAG